MSGFTAVFEPGIYAFLGPNGSGKSTLMTSSVNALVIFDLYKNAIGTSLLTCSDSCRVYPLVVTDWVIYNPQNPYEISQDDDLLPIKGKILAFIGAWIIILSFYIHDIGAIKNIYLKIKEIQLFQSRMK